MISNNFKSTYLLLVFLMFFLNASCQKNKETKETTSKKEIILPGAQQTKQYIPLLKGKKVGVVANQTSVIYKLQKDKEKLNNKEFNHLIDSLLMLSVNVAKIFTPEHGFRGTADAAEVIKNSVDTKTGLPIISLYGKNKKPLPKHLKDIDIVIFDIQDVGVRFYTYISTLHYIMEACAENNISLLVLDRPNPNAHFIDGPTLNLKYKSFVGMHPVPLVYGMTIGEYAQMINGEGWLKGNKKCELTVIPIKNYHHKKEYNLPISPSPNLPNAVSVNLYPSLGFFEGTYINAGRGTNKQFQLYGAPFFPKSNFYYTPKSNIGAKNPKHKNKLCYGVNLAKTKKLDSVNIYWLIDAYKKTPKSKSFFGNTFTIHAGDTILEYQIRNNISAKKIRKSWQKDINRFLIVRRKYLIYP